MNGAGTVRVIGAAVIIALMVLPNNRRVAEVTQPAAPFPIFYAGYGLLSAYWSIGDILGHDWVLTTADAIAAAMCARIVWSWWRRRRQGTPSKVLGLVQDVGHKLAVVNVPAGEGT